MRLRRGTAIWSADRVDPAEVLTAYDEQIRRGAKGAERDEHVVRVLSAGGWSGVTWSDLGGLSGPEVDAVIAAQRARFAPLGQPWEWKHYSTDRPIDLPGRLLAAGFTAEAPETLLAAELADLDRAVPPPPGIRLVPVTDRAGIDALVAVHDAVFGGEHARIGAAIAASQDTVEAVLAVDEATGTPVSAARVEFVPGTAFAGLWGGGTLPEWRHRGVFRALVSHRAALARAAGYRYLQVDASADSRPILRRLGFTELAVTTPFLAPYPA
jgi:GNAT superfamily N-acetyltransferase